MPKISLSLSAEDWGWVFAGLMLGYHEVGFLEKSTRLAIEDVCHELMDQHLNQGPIRVVVPQWSNIEQRELSRIFEDTRAERRRQKFEVVHGG